MSPSLDSALAVLARREGTSLNQLLGAIATLEKEQHARQLSIGISSAVTADLLGIYLRKYGLLAGVRIEVHQGNYDDPVGDVDLFLRAGVRTMIVLPFFDNLMPSFEAQLSGLAPDVIDAKEAEIRGRYRLVFEKTRSFETLYVGTFHAMGELDDRFVAETLLRFNQVLKEEASGFENVRLIDMAEIVTAVGRSSAFDARFYFRNKAPYSGALMDEVARRVGLMSRGFGTYYYKVLVLDCDNTLWGGVVGEDLVSGIKLGPHDYPGNVFWRMQHEFSALERQGVLLCLCSKNNAADVEEVFKRHPDCVLRDEQIVARKVNWQDKPASLMALAKDLNVGVESLVFLDDSAYECEAVRTQLPTVKVFQVPERLSDYPKTVCEIRELFLAGGIDDASRGKTQQYLQRAQAEESRVRFDSHEAYLASLELKVEVARNPLVHVSRISELSMKSNQFNLTTRRYSPADVTQMMNASDCAVYSLHVRDKFGEAGLTGVVVLRFQDGIALVENFLMSCRVIGRGIEMSIWPKIVSDAKENGCHELRAEFIPTAKNSQVADFYDRLGLSLLSLDNEGVRQYRVDVNAFTPPDITWIGLTYVQ